MLHSARHVPIELILRELWALPSLTQAHDLQSHGIRLAGDLYPPCGRHFLPGANLFRVQWPQTSTQARARLWRETRRLTRKKVVVHFFCH